MASHCLFHSKQRYLEVDPQFSQGNTNGAFIKTKLSFKFEVAIFRGYALYIFDARFSGVQKLAFVWSPNFKKIWLRPYIR